MDYDASIRGEAPADLPAIRALHEHAFEGPAEANLVDALRETARPFVSLVSDQDGAVVGHVAFSPATIDGAPSVVAMGLGPIAVQYEWRERGIGVALVRRGLEVCRGLGASLVVVLGTPSYYRRFGFAPASEYGLTCAYDAPEGAFQALCPGPDRPPPGLVRYHEAFRGV